MFPNCASYNSESCLKNTVFVVRLLYYTRYIYQKNEEKRGNLTCVSGLRVWSWAFYQTASHGDCLAVPGMGVPSTPDLTDSLWPRPAFLSVNGRLQRCSHLRRFTLPPVRGQKRGGWGGLPGLPEQLPPPRGPGFCRWCRPKSSVSVCATPSADPSRSSCPLSGDRAVLCVCWAGQAGRCARSHGGCPHPPGCHCAASRVWPGGWGSHSSSCAPLAGATCSPGKRADGARMPRTRARTW